MAEKKIEELEIEKWDAETEDAIDEQILKELEEEENKTDDDDEDFEDDEDLENEEETGEEDEDRADTDEEGDETDSSDDSNGDSDDSEQTDDDNGDSDTDSDGSEDDNDSEDEQAIAEIKEILIKRYNIDEATAQKVIEQDLETAKEYKTKLHAVRDINLLKEKVSILEEELNNKKALELNPYEFKEDRVIIRANGKVTELEKSEFIEKYRELNKDDKELQEMSDDEVYREAKRENQRWVKAQYAERLKKIKDMASNVRNEIIANVKEKYPQFAEDVATQLQYFPDDVLASDSFNKDLPLIIAKGKAFDKAIEEAKKQALEEAKKKGKLVKSRANSPVNKSKPKASSTIKVKLTAAEKQEALDMFEDDDISDEEKFKLYAEIKKGVK